MIAVEEVPPAEVAPTSFEDALFALELRVARRADELSRGHDSTRGHDLAVWFTAEREVIGNSPAAACVS